jgi:hypothetical protein
MATFTFTFTNPVPEGIEVGDIAWYYDTSEESQVKMGRILSIISDTSITVDGEVGVIPPGTDDFIFYVKDPLTSTGQLKGYYAEAQFINTSTEYAELFSVGAQVFESSK